MVQFTLGCVLIALSLFFGIKEIMSNSKITSNRSAEFITVKTKADSSRMLKSQVDRGKEGLISYSPKLKTNLINQLNIDDTKYDFELTPPEDLKKVIVSYKYVIEGYDRYTEAVSLLGEIEKVKGIYVEKMCLNCEVKTKNNSPEQDAISFKIEGDAYVYNSK
ncbi:MAG: hypothetical protein GY793_06010 [Proteobacteria bacterium]|nr:hypothetical protein [Pseudomonadota bacterium]